MYGAPLDGTSTSFFKAYPLLHPFGVDTERVQAQGLKVLHQTVCFHRCAMRDLAQKRGEAKSWIKGD